VIRIVAGTLSVVAAVTLTAGAVARGDDASRVRRLDVVWIDVADRAPFISRGVAAELAALLRPIGIETRVRTERPGGPVLGHETAVILMPGEAPPALRARKVMGAVHAQPQQAATAWVYLPEVMRALGHEARAPMTLPHPARVELGRALGRVAAHELLHLVAPTAPHAHEGLMTANLDRAALVGSGAFVDEGTQASLAGRMPAAGVPVVSAAPAVERGRAVFGASLAWFPDAESAFDVTDVGLQLVHRALWDLAFGS
jgi:hypothetical protein